MSIHVVVGIIENPNIKDCYLIAKRPLDTHLGGFWEFPGGKVESDELPEVALARELEEELAIQITDYVFLFDYVYSYPDKSIQFTLYKVRSYTGKERGNEGQEILWVNKSDLSYYTFPEANKKIIESL